MDKVQEKIREKIAQIICPWELQDLNPGFELKYFDMADQILVLLLLEGKPPLLSDEEILNAVNVAKAGVPAYGSGAKEHWVAENRTIAQAQRDSDWEWMRGEK